MSYVLTRRSCEQLCCKKMKELHVTVCNPQKIMIIIFVNKLPTDILHITVYMCQILQQSCHICEMALKRKCGHRSNYDGFAVHVASKKTVQYRRITI